MTIPGFQEVMLPLLQLCSDDLEHNGKELSDKLANYFELTEEERKIGVSNTRAKPAKFLNTVSWAQSHLKTAKLLAKTTGHNFKITDYGKDILNQNPSKIDINFLRTLPEYIDSIRRKKSTEAINQDTLEISATPQELIEKGYQQIRDNLYSELIEQVKNCSPSFFESLVIDLLLKMGYGGTVEDAGEALGRAGDEGIDGIVKGDRLGFEAIYIQAKKWENPVGRPEIQKFVGALHGKHAKKGLFITTSRFTIESTEYVRNLDVKVILVDGLKLSELMLDYRLGISIEKSYNIYRIDTDYFQEQ